MLKYDVAIAGGGLAGALAATRLSAAGLSVAVVEKSAGPHDKVCGEFLSGEALAELRNVGVEPKDLAAAPMNKVRFSAGDHSATAELPFEALSLTRRLLDEKLLQKASDQGASVFRGRMVSRIDPEGEGWKLSLRDGSCIRADRAVVATGKVDLRALPRPQGIHRGMVGLKSFFDVSPEVEDFVRGIVDVTFFPGGYCGFQLVEDGRVNACMAVEKPLMGKVGGDAWGLFDRLGFSSAVAARIIRGAERSSARPLAIANIPYGVVRRHTDGLYYIGDQASVIPSFCGEGMGLALRSGRIVAEAIRDGLSAEQFQTDFARLVERRVSWTAQLSRQLSRPGVQKLAVRAAASMPWAISALASATRTPLPRYAA